MLHQFILKFVGKTFLILLSISLFVSCDKTESHSGTVGNYYSITVKPPLGVRHPTFDWIILEEPTASQLGYSDLVLKNNGTKMTFQPDEPGEYQFEVVILDSIENEIASKKYLFTMEPPSYAEASPKPEKMVEDKVPIPVTDTLSKLPMIQKIEETLNKTEKENENLIERLKDTLSIEENIQVSLTEENQKVEELRKPSAPPTKEPKKPEQPIQQLKITQPPAYHRYTIQVSSWDNLNEAQKELTDLIKRGFDAYLQKVYFPELDEIWYRVRIGAFDQYTTASQAAKQISNVIQKSTWVDNIRLNL